MVSFPKRLRSNPENHPRFKSNWDHCRDCPDIMKILRGNNMNKKVVFYLTVMLALFCVNLRAERYKSYSLTGGVGLGSGNGSGYVKLNYQLGHHFFSFRAGFTTNLIGEHGDDNKDLGLHYSFCLSEPGSSYLLTLGIGIALTELDWEDKIYVGFPLEAQFLFPLSRSFHMGIYYFENFNSCKNYRGFGLAFQYRLKRR